MKLSEQLKQDHECGDFGKALAGYSERAEKLESEIEQLRVQLAGCGVAAMQNTAESIKDRAVEGDYGYSASYSDVCKAVDREIRYRNALKMIALGTEDTEPPHRSAPAEVLKRLAKEALAASV